MDFRDDEVEDDTDDDGIVDRYDIDDDNDGILDVRESGVPTPVTAISGTLPDGTTYNVSITDATLNVLPDGDFDINSTTGGDSIVTITTSSPVGFTISNTRSDHGEVWNGPVTGSAGTRVTTNGANWIRTPGTVGQNSIVLNGRTADANASNAFVQSDADWGSITTNSATQVTFRSSANEGFSVSLFSELDSWISTVTTTALVIWSKVVRRYL